MSGKMTGIVKWFNADKGFGFIHRKTETVTSNAGLVSESFFQTVTERYSHIFDTVVVIGGKISETCNVERDPSMEPDLFQHVIEEMQAGRYFRLAEMIQVHFYGHCGLPCFSETGSGPSL